MRWILSGVCSLSFLLITGCLNLEGHSPASTSPSTETAGAEESPSSETQTASSTSTPVSPVVQERDTPYTGPPPMIPTGHTELERGEERRKGCRDAVFYEVNESLNQAIVFYAKPETIQKLTHLGLTREGFSKVELKDYPEFEVYLDVYEKPFKNVHEFPYCLPEGVPKTPYHTRWTAGPDTLFFLSRSYDDSYKHVSPAGARLGLYFPLHNFAVFRLIHLPSKTEIVGRSGYSWGGGMYVILGWEPTEEVRSEADLSKLLVPQFKFSKNLLFGCSRLVFIVGNDWDEAVLFKYNTEILDLMSGPKTFSLENPPESLEVSIDLYLFKKDKEHPYCTDTLTDKPSVNLKAISGTVELIWERVAESADDNRPDGYQYLTIHLKNAVFTSPDGKKVVPLKALNVIRVPMYGYDARRLPETRIEVPAE